MNQIYPPHHRVSYPTSDRLYKSRCISLPISYLDANTAQVLT